MNTGKNHPMIVTLVTANIEPIGSPTIIILLITNSSKEQEYFHLLEEHQHQHLPTPPFLNNRMYSDHGPNHLQPCQEYCLPIRPSRKHPMSGSPSPDLSQQAVLNVGSKNDEYCHSIWKDIEETNFTFQN